MTKNYTSYAFPRDCQNYSCIKLVTPLCTDGKRLFLLQGKRVLCGEHIMGVGWHNVPVDTGQLLILRVDRIPLPKEQRFELRPNVGICPVLTEDIGGIEFPR